jgi:ubiquinone/menaquinone biosynthesis C-methylase UbiE
MNTVKAHFDGLSATYSRNFSRVRSGKSYEFGKRAALVATLVQDASGRLLDCACGTGEVTAIALKAGSFSHATINDISGAMLRAAKEQLKTGAFDGSLEYRQMDIRDYNPGVDERFDVILCLGLIAHVGNLGQLLGRLKAMLSRNGRIVLQTSVADHLGVRIVRHLTARRYSRRNGYALSYYSLRDIEMSCQDAGLAVQKTARYCFGLPFGDAVWARGNYWLETITQKLSARYGAEAICVLCHRQ